jgi:methionyl aminopeptidase
MAIVIKTPAEIEKMRRSGLIVYEILEELRSMVKPGVTTVELNERAVQLTEKKGATSAFLNYAPSNSNLTPFPGVICASRNEAIVHGIPNDTPLVDGDIISIDYGCFFEGYCGDSAVTIPVGNVSDRVAELLKVTKESLEKAIQQCRPGKRIGDISSAVQEHVERHGFGIVREFVGHGVGQKMHEEPAIPNFGRPNQGKVLKPGMVIAIEPMVTIGGYSTKILDDGWTAVTKDGTYSAHFEHTVAITDGHPFVLSRP